jgi:hypothetical protein
MAESDASEQMPRSHFSPCSSSPGLGSQFPQDSEMDMMETLNSPPPSRLEAPHVTELDGNGASGRMPTPIQPSFAAQVRGQQSGWAGPAANPSPLNGVVNMGHQPSGLAEDNSVPRTMMTESDWHAVQKNRRLPSPISEGEDSPSNQAGALSDAGLEAHDASVASHNAALQAMDHPNAMMDVEPRGETPPLDANGEPTTPSPKRGHQRSMHTVNSWTWQPGMKKSFSIGYRSDCEKCRMKVPGHFNHIIVS